MSRQTTVRQRGTRPGIRAAVRRRRLLTAAIAVVLITVAAATAGELIARQLIRDKTAGKLAALGDIKVSENGSLALWDLLDRHIPQLDITGDDATLGPFRQVAVQAQLDGVALGATPAISSAHAVITVPDPSIAAAVQTRAPRVKVSSVTSDPAAGTVTVAIGPGGIGQLVLKPLLSHGKVTFSVASLTVLGSRVPLSALGRAGSGLSGAFGARDSYPLGLAVASLTVTPDGVRITLNGGRSTLKGS